MRRDKGGAIVEFVDMKDAGKAGMMGGEAGKLGEGCRVGEVAELLARGKKGGAFVASGEGSAGPNGKGKEGLKIRPAMVSRPGQSRGGRGGRRGGLGFKRGGAGVEGKTEVGEGEGKKSNADFREMFLAGKGGEQ